VEIRLASELIGKLRLGWLELEGHSVREEDPSLAAEARALEEEIRSRYQGRSPGEIPEIVRVRKLWSALGIDPTKNRPSSEALVRRVLRGRTLPRINTLVDAANLSSLRYLLPLGLYDSGAVIGDLVEARVGQEGEGYPGIGKERVNVAGRVCLADREGPFGNPTSDSNRTKVTLETRRSVLAIFAPVSCASDELHSTLERMGEALLRWSGGRRVRAAVHPEP
jgi:DNA/RNA-binding domain of Phe-tRNA-synthetase-like protein